LSRIVASIRNFREYARFAARQFRRAPAYVIFAILVLALGIGTVAMFTISYGVLLKPLPFRADRQLFDLVFCKLRPSFSLSRQRVAGSSPVVPVIHSDLREIKSWTPILRH
jgi:hypothetical protein